MNGGVFQFPVATQFHFKPQPLPRPIVRRCSISAMDNNITQNMCLQCHMSISIYILKHV